jgi:hypothetical protein
MKLWTAVLAIAAALSMAAVAEARGGAAKAGKPGKGPTLRGTVVSVAADGTSVVIEKQKTHEQVTVPVGPETRVKGAAAKVADLKAGERVAVRPDTGTAKVIVVKDAKVGGRHHGKAGGRKGRRNKGGGTSA